MALSTVTPPSHRIVAILAAASLVLLGHFLIAPRDVHLGYDATFYTRMIDGPMQAVPAPFKFRVLVPWLARQLPLSGPSALQLISYASLFGCYLVMLASCARVGLSLRDSIFGVAAVWGSTWHLYLFWNPYMTDAFGLLMLAVMMWAILTETIWVFALASSAGVLAREGTLMLVPAWLVTRQIRTTIALVGGAILVAALPRFWMAADTTIAAPPVADGGVPTGPLMLVRQLHAIWGITWLLAIGGAASILPPHRRRLGAVAAALVIGAAVASTVATDTGRMFGFLAPVLAVACAQLYAVLRRTSPALAVVLTATIAVQWVFNAPDVVVQPSSWLAGWPRRAFAIAQLILGIVILLRVVAPRFLRVESAID